jgi:hypothetical protein
MRKDPVRKDPGGKDPEWIKFAVTVTVTVVTIVVGLLQFGHTYAQSVRQPFLKSQMDQCLAASESVARLASTVDLETWKKSREQFWMLYLGPLAIVENVDPTGKNLVANAMVDFGTELKMVDAASPQLPSSRLESPAIRVSHACRDLLISRWRIGILGLLPGD